eukprot:6107948-Amphidinium_carterae.1
MELSSRLKEVRAHDNSNQIAVQFSTAMAACKVQLARERVCATSTCNDKSRGGKKRLWWGWSLQISVWWWQGCHKLVELCICEVLVLCRNLRNSSTALMGSFVHMCHSLEGPRLESA